jgi:hypothetical protein
MTVLDALLRLWRTPSSFAGDPRGYVLNQLGHGYVIGALPALAWGPPAVAPLVVLYVLLVESPQLVLWGGTAADAAEDTAHVATVAVAVAWGVWPALAAHALFVLSGALARFKGGSHDY